jgi:hypothetical protein
VTRCCRGMRNTTKDQVLQALAALGLPILQEAQIWGPINNWKVVDRHGRDLSPPIHSILPLAEAAVATLTADLTVDGYEVRKLSVLLG